jgi:excisionase family DNA binding protein
MSDTLTNYLTVKQAAARSAVSPGLIYGLCQQGRLPHVRLGLSGRRGCIRIREYGLAALMEECRREAEDDPGDEAYRRHLR